MGNGLYVASRASIPARGIMWRGFRAAGFPVCSTWIDEDGEGQTGDFGELWERIRREIIAARGLILYAEPGDFPLKGALVEVGMAMAAAIPIRAVLPGVRLNGKTMRPVGSWIAHKRIKVVDNVETAFRELLSD